VRAVPRLLYPLAQRDFALFSAAATVSFLGDGVLTVALAFQVYQLSNVPTALSLVILAWTVPLVLLLLVGGTVSDRVDRRLIMVSADLVRFGAIGVTAALSISGELRLWHLLLLAPVSGAATAFFNPASGALLPDLVPPEQLAEANGLYGAAWPLALQLLGPALGGILVATSGPGLAILFDAFTFAASAGFIFGIRGAPRRVRPQAGAKAIGELLEGLRFVGRNAWCGASLLGYSLGLLGTRGPVSVLVPYLVKNGLHTGPAAYGSVVGAWGLGAILASLLAGHLGLPRRPVLVMCAGWGLSFLGVAVYGAITTIWQGLGLAFGLGGAHSFGLVIWFTMLQARVPRSLLGRVSGVDWLVSYALVPVSLAVTGPLSSLLGVRGTFVAGGTFGGLGMLAMLLVPSVRTAYVAGVASADT